MKEYKISIYNITLQVGELVTDRNWVSSVLHCRISNPVHKFNGIWKISQPSNCRAI